MRHDFPANPLCPSAGRRHAVPLAAAALLMGTSLLAGCGSSKAGASASTTTSTSTTVHTAAQAASGASSSASTTGSTAAPTSTATSAAPAATVTVTRSAAAPVPAQAATRPVIDASGVPDSDIAFSSPSGHIACQVGSSSDGWLVRCDVDHSNWDVSPAQQATCDDEGSMGSAAELPGVGKPYLFCQSDTVLGTTTRGSMGTKWVDHTPGAQWGAIRGQQQAVLPYNTTLKLPGGLSCVVQTAAGMTCTNAGGHSFTVAMQGYHFS